MAEETTTAEVDTPEAGAEESETQSLLSAEPVEQTEVKEETPVPHLAQETDDLVEAKETAPAERPEHIPDRTVNMTWSLLKASMLRAKILQSF